MARQDKESKKEQPVETPAPAGGGYANPAPEPGGYGDAAPREAQAKAASRKVSLRVLVYAAADARQASPRTDKSALIEDARIKLDGNDVKFSDYQESGADGTATWRDLPPGHYTVTASHTGFQDAKSVPVDLTQTGHGSVEVCLVPLPATLRFQAFHDVDCCGDPRDCETISQVPFELYQGDRQVGMGTSQGDWTEVTLYDFGRTVVRPEPHAQVNGQWVQLPASRPLVFTAVPGGVHSVYAPYQPSLSTLRVSALFAGDDGTDHHIPGVQIRLYAGAVPSGRPLRDRRTEHGNALVFSDLPSGPYTVLAVCPEHFQGGVLEAFDPADSSVVVTLGPGAAEEYEF
ncbi:MAG: carboxypeptidase regulatory-like domain-containing protein, partial [Thermoanaerobaculia bacterium]